MIKFRLYYDKDLAENFLNSMSSKGYAMRNFFMGFFFFDKCKDNEYTYRVDLLNGKSLEEKSDYIQLVKDSGGEYVQRWGPWAFFRKKGEFVMYSDSESKIDFYSRVRRMFLLLGIAELGISISIWRRFLDEYNNFFTRGPWLINSVLITLVTLIFLFQVYKCNRKIKSLKKEL